MRAFPGTAHSLRRRTGTVRQAFTIVSLCPCRAEQGFAGDALQPPLVPRYGFRARLKPGVRCCVYAPSRPTSSPMPGGSAGHSAAARPRRRGSVLWRRPPVRRPGAAPAPGRGGPRASRGSAGAYPPNTALEATGHSAHGVAGAGVGPVWPAPQLGR